MRSERSSNSLDMETQFLKANGRPNLQLVPNFRPAHPGSALLRIEIDTVGYSDEHIAVGYATMLGHPTPMQSQSGSSMV